MSEECMCSSDTFLFKMNIEMRLNIEIDSTTADDITVNTLKTDLKQLKSLGRNVEDLEYIQALIKVLDYYGEREV